MDDEDFLKSLVDYEDSQYDKTPYGIDEATYDITKILNDLAAKSCKSIKLKKVKIKKLNKKPWVDNEVMEVRDLKKIINKYGIKLRQNPFDLNTKNSFYKYCKELKKLVKKKKLIYKRELFEKLTHLQETDPQKYWELLKTLKNEDCKNNDDSKIRLENYKKNIFKCWEKQKNIMKILKLK